MSLVLNTIPGFSDLPDSALAADKTAFGLHAAEISSNAAFGMVNLEIFIKIYKHGDTVDLPVSARDGYTYSRDELMYFWTVENSTDSSTSWISGPDCLWFMNWDVNQTTGEVFCEEWYERSSTADSRMASKSNDGTLAVFTIGQRQRTNIFMSAPAAFTAMSEADLATDKPYKESIAQDLNHDAKFGVVGTEVFYLGEYVNGQTVTMPTSPVDGHAYSSSECKFMHAWRWTNLATAYVQPPGARSDGIEQAAPFSASVDSSGVCTIQVLFATNGGEGYLTPSGYGRIAVFAFCRRSATPGSLPLADDFTELPSELFFPGNVLRASTLLILKKNIDEAILTPEFFGPTDYATGATIPLPVSPVDGYTYSRDELQYVWTWQDTKNNNGGSHIRLPLFFGSISSTTGVTAMQCWRLPPGGPFLDDCNTNARMRVLVVATRQASHPELIYTDAVEGGDGSDGVDGGGGGSGGSGGTHSVPAIVILTGTANIIVSKATTPVGVSQAFNFATDYGPGFTLHDGESHDSGPLAAGTYHITETSVTSAWTTTLSAVNEASVPISPSPPGTFTR